MKWWFYLIFLFFVVLIQTTFVNFNFLLVWVLIWALLEKQKEAIILAFFGGLLLDLSLGTNLGLASLLYLLLVGLIGIYSRKFSLKNFFFWLLIFPLANLFFKGLRGEGWHFELKENLGLIIVVFFIYFGLKKLNLITKEEEIKLKV